MEQEETYISGFNSGYKLAQFQPQLFEKLKTALSKENDFERGILEGAEEFEKTKEQSRESDLENIRASKDKGKDKELNR